MEEYDYYDSDGLININGYDYNIYKSYQKMDKPYREFSEFLKTLLDVDLTIDQFNKMSESEKIEFKRNFKIDQIIK
jgi:hypothetical protein